MLNGPQTGVTSYMLHRITVGGRVNLLSEHSTPPPAPSSYTHAQELVVRVEAAAGRSEGRASSDALASGVRCLWSSRLHKRQVYGTVGEKRE